MIDKEAFAQGMGQLGGAFGREIDGPVTRMYYAVIGPKLTDEEWHRAVRETVATETFWPSPAVLLGKAGASSELQAMAVYDEIRRVLRDNGGFLYTPYAAVEPFVKDGATWTAIVRCGGLREMAEANPRKFVKAYTDALTPRPAIDAGESPDPRVKKLTAGLARQLSLVGGRERAIPENDR